MEFAGHPIIGTGHFLAGKLDPTAQGQVTHWNVSTKAGDVPIHYEPSNQLVYATVPQNFYVHKANATIDQIRLVQTSLPLYPSQLENVSATHPVVSIVKGVTYALVDLTNRHELFAGLVPGNSPQLDLDDGWGPSFTGVMFYRIASPCYQAEENNVVIWHLRVRMIAIDLEDPACGSGGSSLCAYLALSSGHQSRQHCFNIEQGIEMGRHSRITVEVLLDEERNRVLEVKLAGQATLVAEGRIYVD